MIGKRIRLKKLLGGAENAVVVAIDHGASFGPIPGLLDLPKEINRLKQADGVLINPGMIEHCQEFFSAKDAPLLIARLSWTTAYCFPWKYKAAHTTEVLSPDEALALGAEMATACCLLKTGKERIDNENIKTFTRIVKEKERCGLPLIGEFYPVDAEAMPLDQLHKLVYMGSRILAELGADLIKTFYTGEKFEETAKAVPVPILVLGAKKLPKELDALELAHQAVNQGARGVVFGRNVFQAKDPQKFIQALKEVVKQGKEPEDAAHKYNL